MTKKEKIKIKEIKAYAETLQKSFCCYRTVNGDHHTCDCKFAQPGELLRGQAGMGEDTGCCEARAIIWLCQEMLEGKSSY